MTSNLCNNFCSIHLWFADDVTFTIHCKEKKRCLKHKRYVTFVHIALRSGPILYYFLFRILLNAYIWIIQWSNTPSRYLWQIIIKTIYNWFLFYRTECNRNVLMKLILDSVDDNLNAKARKAAALGPQFLGAPKNALFEIKWTKKNLPRKCW